MEVTSPDTRAHIIDVALDLFSTQGYAGTSLREVAERMGFTKAALYYHFSSKEQLVAELLQPLFADIDALIEAHEGAVITTADRRRFLQAYAEVAVTHRRLVRFAYSDLSVLSHAGLGPRAMEQGRRVTALVQPDHETLPARVRAAVAISGMQIAIAALSEVDPDVVRRAAVDAAAAALGVPAARRSRAGASGG